MAQQTTAQLFFHCMRCSQKICCPVNATTVECPSCSGICMPYAEYISHCPECQTIMRHPSYAQIVQCPQLECNLLLDVSKRPPERCAVDSSGNIFKNVHQEQQMTSITPYRSAFEFFKREHEQLPVYTVLSGRHRNQRLHARWSQLTRAQKEKYQCMSINDRKRYCVEIQSVNQ